MVMNSRISSYFFFTLLLCAAVASVIIFLPFLTPIVLAIAAAVIAYPLYKAILRIIGGGSIRRNLASLFTVFFVVIVVLVPLFFIIAKIYSEVQSLYALLIDESGRSQVISTLNTLSSYLSKLLFNAFPNYSFDSLNVAEYLKNALAWVFGNLDTIFSSFAKVAAYVFVFLMALFYFLRDGEQIKKKFIAWSPLLDTHDEYISLTMKRAVRSVFLGTITVSVIQGFMTGIGFLIFGIPAPAVWGSVAAVASMIPGLGTSLVIIPGIIYLIFSGQFGFAVGLFLWGVVAVGLIDNFIGPQIVGSGIRVHSFLILISVLGGLATFGLIGFVLGPLILAFLFALLDIYRKSFGSKTGTDSAHKIE